MEDFGFDLAKRIDALTAKVNLDHASMIHLGHQIDQLTRDTEELLERLTTLDHQG